MRNPDGLVSNDDYIDYIRSGSQTDMEIYFDQIDVPIGMDAILSSGIKVTDVFNGNEKFTFGNTRMRQITFSLFNIEPYKSIVEKAKQLMLIYSVNIPGTSNVTRVRIYDFYIQKKKYKLYSDVVEIIANDKMVKFEIPADPFLKTISSPITLINLLFKIAQYVNVQYYRYDDDIPSYFDDKEFDASVFVGKGYTLRDILRIAGEATGTIAIIDTFGNLKMQWFQIPTQVLVPYYYNITNDYIYSIEGSKYYPAMKWSEFDAKIWDEADAMSWEMVEGSSSAYNYDFMQIVDSENKTEIIYPYNAVNNPYIITDNPIFAAMSQQEVSDYIPILFNRLRSLNAFPLNVECQGYWMVEGGDIINVQVGNDMVEFPVFQCTTEWHNGATTESLEMSGEIL